MPAGSRNAYPVAQNPSRKTSAGGDKKRPNALIRLAVPRGSVLSLDPSVVPDLEQVH